MKGVEKLEEERYHASLRELSSLRRSLDQIHKRVDKPPTWNSLEVVKLLVSVMTPLAVFFLGLFVNARLRRVEGEERERRRVADEQQQKQLQILEEQRQMLEKQQLQIEEELRKIQEQQLCLANRNEFQRLTLEINKEMIRDPSLDAFNHPVSDGRKPDQVKLEALGYIYLNMFELIYEYYHYSRQLTERETEEWRVWDETIRNKLADSLVLRTIIEKEDSPRIYYTGFFDYIQRLLKGTPNSGPQADACGTA